jgi:hypothetical protein
MTGKSPDVHLTGTTTINGGFLAGNVKLAKWYPSSNHLSTVYLRIYLAIYTNYLSSCPASLCTNLMQNGLPHAHMQIQCIYAPIYILYTSKSKRNLFFFLSLSFSLSLARCGLSSNTASLRRPIEL